MILLSLYFHLFLLLYITHFTFCYFIAISYKNVIAHPGQDVELTCNVTGGTASWFINGQGPYTVPQLFSGTVTGYNTSGNNLIIKDIVMNDHRNNNEYQCIIQSVIIGDLLFLRVAGEFTYVYAYYNYVMKFLYVY